MATFAYRATDKHGREIRGRIEASHEGNVYDRLRNMGFFPTEVKKAKNSASTVALEELPVIKQMIKFINRGKVKMKHLTTFTRQLATLIGAGLPLRRSLTILEEQAESRNLKEAVAQIGEDIESGSTFSESLNKFPRIFNKLYINMVKAGEISGALEQVLDRLAIFGEKEAALRSKVKSALMYPTFVILIAGILVCVLILKVVPKFAEVYEGFGAKLPAMTQVLVDISTVMHHYMPIVLGILAGLVFLYWRVNATDTGKFYLDRAKLRIPVFGQIIRKAAIAKFARTFATLLETGVPILQTLTIVKDTTGNEVVSRAMVEVHNSIREGDTVSEPLRSFPVFPPLVVHMIAVGEETGAIDKMLIKVAEAYEREVETAVDGLTALIEPLLIVFLGVIIGFIVIAMYMPIFNLINVIGAPDKRH